VLSLAGRGAIVAGTRPPAATLLARLTAEGVRVALIHHGDEAAANALLPVVASHTNDCFLIDADPASEEEVKRAVAEAKRTLGDVSFCINLGSEVRTLPAEQTAGAAWDAGMLAARSAFLLTLHAGLAMTANEGPTRGHILQLIEPEDLGAPSGELLTHQAAQAAIAFMTRAFALEFSGWGILVNAIASDPAALDGQPAAADVADLILTALRLETVTGEEIGAGGSARPRPAL
jgi:NAD(P)-dependent dehydrogenase (short-subunit alcohol dehydrogenase family)